MEKIFESFITLFHNFFYGAQTLDFIKENSNAFLKTFDNLPPKSDNLEIILHRNEFYLNSIPFSLNEKNYKEYFESALLFEKLKIKGIVIKKNIKEENLIFWLQDLQKGDINANPWIRVIRKDEENYAQTLKFNFLKVLRDCSFLISKKNQIDQNISKGGIISYIPLREEIQRFYKSLSLLDERGLCLIPFFQKEEERFLGFVILLYVLLEPLKLSDEIIEDLIFSSFFYDLTEQKKWVSLIQSKNFSNGGFLSFLSSCNHPSLIFTIFYCAYKFNEFQFSKGLIQHPSAVLQKIYQLPDISDEVKNYIVSVLGKIPPSSPALTEECEPCLVISRKEIAIYEENKFILKEGKAEKPVPFEQFPFNPLFIILNLDIIK